MKKYSIMIIVVILTVCLAAPSAFAGSKQRHRWEGVAIGLGAAILGGAIINNSYARPSNVVHYTPAPKCYPPSYNRRYCPPPSYRHYPPPPKRGHWEVRKTWVPPVYRKVWNPGHYNQYNQWVPGEWIQIEEQAGYWTKERVWVSHR